MRLVGTVLGLLVVGRRRWGGGWLTAVVPSAEVHGITVEYDEHGAGEPILLLMGLATQMIAWPDEVVGTLAGAGHRVIRMDNRDIGRSSKTEGPAPTRADLAMALLGGRLARSDYVIADMAADVVGLLDHLDIGRVHLVGASMGGMIAQQVTIDHPDRVASLTSIMSNTGDRRSGGIKPSFLPTLRASALAPRPASGEEAVTAGVHAYRVIAGPHFDEAETRQLVEGQFARSDDSVGRVRQLLAIQASPNRTPGLRQITAPTLVVHGMLDKLVLPSGGAATARAVPGSRLLMFPDMAHDLPTHRRAEIAEEIVRNARRAPLGRPATGTGGPGVAHAAS